MNEASADRQAPAEVPRADTEAQEAPKARSQTPPVETLVDLFTVKGANAAKLLRELDKGTSWAFDPADVEATLALLPDRDPALQRTRQLLHEAIGTREGRFARTAGDFALRAMTEDLPSGWHPDHGDPVATLGTLAEHLAPRLSDAKNHKRPHNVLMIATDLLSHRRGLAFEQAAPVLRNVVGRPEDYEQQHSNPRRHRIASLTVPRNDLPRVRDVLDLLQPWEAELRAAETVATEAAGERNSALDRAVAAEQRESESHAELEHLRKELATARQDAQALTDQARDVRIVASSDVTELRSRTLSFLNARLRELLVTAKEADAADPPRTPTALRLIDQALDEIRREIEWLRSSA